jgi:hypothetical protein
VLSPERCAELFICRVCLTWTVRPLLHSARAASFLGSKFKQELALKVAHLNSSSLHRPPQRPWHYLHGQ